MKKTNQLLPIILVMGLFCFTHLAFSQNLSTESPMAAQGAQTTLEANVQSSAESTAAKEIGTIAQPKETRKVSRVAIPDNASKKQIKRLEKINQAIADQELALAENQPKSPTRLQKAATRLVLKKMEKKMQKAGIDQPHRAVDVTDFQSVAASQDMNKLTLIGIILMGSGLLFLFIIPIIGLLFFLGGLICLILGLVNS